MDRSTDMDLLDFSPFLEGGFDNDQEVDPDAFLGFFANELLRPEKPRMQSVAVHQASTVSTQRGQAQQPAMYNDQRMFTQSQQSYQAGQDYCQDCYPNMAQLSVQQPSASFQQQQYSTAYPARPGDSLQSYDAGTSSPSLPASPFWEEQRDSELQVGTSFYSSQRQGDSAFRRQQQPQQLRLQQPQQHYYTDAYVKLEPPPGHANGSSAPRQSAEPWMQHPAHRQGEGAADMAEAASGSSQLGSGDDVRGARAQRRSKTALEEVAFKEKSKDAQKRFRTRQKAKLDEANKQIGELSKRLSQVLISSADMESRCRALEQALHKERERNEALRQHATRAQPQPAQLHHIRTSPPAAPALAAVVPNPAPQTPPPASVANNPAPSTSLGAAASGQPPGGPSGATGERPGGAVGGGDVTRPLPPWRNPKAVVVFTVREGQQLRLTVEQLKNLSLEEHAKLWKEYVNQMAKCLADAKGNPDSPAGSRLVQLALETSVLNACLSHMAHMKHRKLIAQKMEDSDVFGAVGGVDNDMYRVLTTSLKLSEEQRARMVMLRRMYLSKMGVVLRERRLIRQAAAALGEVADPCHMAITQDYLAALELADRLAVNLQHDQSLSCQFKAAVYSRVLLPVQYAEMIVGFYPYAPDPLPIANWVAQEAGEPDGSLILAGAAPAGSPAAPPSPPGDLGNDWRNTLARLPWRQDMRRCVVVADNE